MEGSSLYLNERGLTSRLFKKNEKRIKGINQEKEEKRGTERTSERIFVLHIFMTCCSVSPCLEVSPHYVLSQVPNRVNSALL